MYSKYLFKSDYTAVKLAVAYGVEFKLHGERRGCEIHYYIFVSVDLLL